MLTVPSTDEEHAGAADTASSANDSCFSGSHEPKNQISAVDAQAVLYVDGPHGTPFLEKPPVPRELASVHGQDHSSTSSRTGSIEAADSFLEDERRKRSKNSTGPPDLFISYCGRDGNMQDVKKSLISNIGDEAEDGQPGFTYWADFLDLGDSAGPVKWLHEIDEAIKASAKFVAFIDSEYLKSHNCIMEVAMAIAADKPVVPIMLDNKGWEILTRVNAARKCWTSHLSNYKGYSSDDGKIVLTLELVEKVFAHIAKISFCACRSVDIELNGWPAVVKNMRNHISKDLEYHKEWTELSVRSSLWKGRGCHRSLLLTGDEIPQWSTWCNQASKHGYQPPPTDVQREFVARSSSIAKMRMQTLLLSAVALVLVVTVLGIAATITAIKSDQAKRDAEAAKNDAEVAKNDANKARDYAERQQQNIFLTSVKTHRQSDLSKTVVLLMQRPDSSIIESRSLLHSATLAAVSGSYNLVIPHFGRVLQRLVTSEYLFYKVSASRGRTRAIEFNRNSDRMAHGGDDGRVFVHELSHMVIPDARLRKVLTCLDGEHVVVDLSWSPSGQALAAGFAGGSSICLWRASGPSSYRVTWNLSAAFTVPSHTQSCMTLPGEDHVLAVAFSPTSESRLAAASTNGALGIWDVSQEMPAVAQTLRPCNENGTQTQAHAVRLAWLADGRYLLVGTSLGYLELWDTSGAGPTSPVLTQHMEGGDIQDLRLQPLGEGLGGGPEESLVTVVILSGTGGVIHEFMLRQEQSSSAWELSLRADHNATEDPSGGEAPPTSAVLSPDGESLLVLGQGRNASVSIRSLADGGISPLQALITEEMGHLKLPSTFPSTGAWATRDIKMSPSSPASALDTLAFHHNNGYSTKDWQQFLNPTVAGDAQALDEGVIFVAQRNTDLGQLSPHPIDLLCGTPEDEPPASDKFQVEWPGLFAWDVSSGGARIVGAEIVEPLGLKMCIWDFDEANRTYYSTSATWIDIGDALEYTDAYHVYQLKFSPDRSRLFVSLKLLDGTSRVAQVRSNMLQMYDTSGPVPRLMYSVPPWEDRSFCSWSPDSVFLACAVDTKSILVWRAQAPPGPEALRLNHTESDSGSPMGAVAWREVSRTRELGTVVYELASSRAISKNCWLHAWEIRADIAMQRVLDAAYTTNTMSIPRSKFCAFLQISSKGDIAMGSQSGVVAAMKRELNDNGTLVWHTSQVNTQSTESILGTWSADGTILLHVDGESFTRKALSPLNAVEVNEDLTVRSAWQMDSNCNLALSWLPMLSEPAYFHQDRLVCLSTPVEGHWDNPRIQFVSVDFKGQFDLLRQLTYGDLDETDIEVMGLQGVGLLQQ